MPICNPHSLLTALLLVGSVIEAAADSLSLPTLRASHAVVDFMPGSLPVQEAWQRTKPVYLEEQSHDRSTVPKLRTRVQALWTSHYLYLRFEAPFSQLTVFEPARLHSERLGLWDRDVVEAFIGSDPERPNRYTEFEVAPTGEKLDLKLDLPARDFAWSSGWEAAVHLERKEKIWWTELRIPLKSLAAQPPQPGARWRLNLFRCSHADQAALAWSPTLTDTFHVPSRFGWLEFDE